MSLEVRMLSLWQPYALFAALGLKQNETRSWGAPPGGLIAIHAAKRRPTIGELTVLKTDFDEIGRGADFDRVVDLLKDDRYYGSINCIAKFTSCARTEIAHPVDPLDRICGDWTLGRWAWRLENPCALAQPIPVKGHQGLRRIVDAELLDVIERQIAFTR